ncbi:MAG: hypothetical protein WBH87_06905 [Acetivibrionales bacterium]
MKRILVMLLCVSIMFTFLAACGSTSDNKGGVSGKKTEVKISCWGIETEIPTQSSSRMQLNCSIRRTT